MSWPAYTLASINQCVSVNMCHLIATLGSLKAFEMYTLAHHQTN